MNFHLFKFSSEASTEISKFRRFSNEMKLKSVFCDLDDNNKMKHIFPWEDTVASGGDNKLELIYIGSSDDEDNNTKKDVSDVNIPEHSICNEEIDTLSISTEYDLVQAIKENLEIQFSLNTYVLQNLNKLPIANLENLFKLLKDELNSDQVKNFGLSLRNVKSNVELVIKYFIKNLLVQKLGTEYTDELQLLTDQYFINYNKFMKEEISNWMLENDNCSTLLQYISKLNWDRKSSLFGMFVTRCDKLENRHSDIFQILLNPQINYSHLNNLVELMSKHANEFSTDKSFGKLIINVINLLGKNAPMLEQPLKHIIGIHRSIWKTKIQKEFNAYLGENSCSQNMA